MKELICLGKKIRIRSPEEINDWDSDFQKELYKFCFEFIPSKGIYKPYINIDKFVQGEVDSYEFNLKEKINFYGLKLDNRKQGAEEITEKCDNKNQFLNMKIIRFRLLSKYPELLGIFNNIVPLQKNIVDNAKYILNLDTIDSTHFKEIILLNHHIYNQTWNRRTSKSEENSGIS